MNVQGVEGDLEGLGLLSSFKNFHTVRESERAPEERNWLPIVLVMLTHMAYQRTSAAADPDPEREHDQHHCGGFATVKPNST